jgi:hypothetical protein
LEVAFGSVSITLIIAVAPKRLLVYPIILD